ncbi:unnamed protein product [Leptosia nina]|uniref:Uncharacterized protein n=1 Tax=Leptosia nina TaxID=320188 RepID=A0AAV1JAW3_9NEOP
MASSRKSLRLLNIIRQCQNIRLEYLINLEVINDNTEGYRFIKYIMMNAAHDEEDAANKAKLEDAITEARGVWGEEQSEAINQVLTSAPHAITHVAGVSFMQRRMEAN